MKEILSVDKFDGQKNPMIFTSLLEDFTRNCWVLGSQEVFSWKIVGFSFPSIMVKQIVKSTYDFLAHLVLYV